MKIRKMLSKIIAVKLACILVCLFCVSLVCLFCVSGFFCVNTLEAKDTFTAKYIQTIFNQKNGIGSNEVNCLYQSSSGYIWIGTDSGLYRTSGSEFKSINLWETDRTDVYSINCIMQDTNGRMWIGTDNYGLFFIEDGNNYHFRNEYYDGVKTIYDFCETDDGIIYVATASGLYVSEYLEEQGQYVLTPYVDSSLSKEIFSDIEINGDSIWGICENKIYTWNKEGVLNIIDTTTYTTEELTCLRKINGDMYIGTKGRDVIRCFDNKAYEVLNASIEGIKSFMYDSNGYIWACSDNGIGYFDKKKKFIKCNDFEIDNYLSDMIQDYEGNYWISSTRMGVLLLSRSKFTDFNMYTGMPSSMVNTIYCKDETKYIGTDDGLTIYESGKKITNDLTEKLEGVSVRHIVGDSKGNVWIGTYRRYGVIKYSPNGDMVEISRGQGLPDSAVNYILPIKDGNVAVATEAGVSILDKDAKVINSYGHEEGVVYNKIYCLYENDNGEIFAGSDGGGIYVINPAVKDRVQNYNVDFGLNSNVITCFEKGESGLWIGTDNGICFYNETFRKISNIEYSNSIYDILYNNGSVWIVGSMGIIRTYEDELLGSTALSGRYYNTDDGLTKTINSISNSAIDKSGNLYICCNNGICVLDTNNIPYNNVQPKVKVTGIDIDGVKYEFDDLEDGVLLKSNVSRMTIQFAIFSYANRNNIQVEYYLDGFDSEPIVLSGDAAMEAVYTNLDGGVYEFKLSAYNGDGIASEQEVSFVIEKEKSLFENQIARIILLIAIVGIFVLLCIVLVRVQRLLKNKNAALESLSKEHEEVVKSSSAKNDYLANMSNEIKIPINAIMVKADEMIHVLEADNPNRESLKSIYDIGEGIITKVDDIILLAKIEAGKLEKHDAQYSITTLMYSLSEYAVAKIGDKGIRFFVEIGDNTVDNVIGDEEKITAILTRLIDNAIKNTKEGSITISVDSYIYDDERSEEVNVEFTISDTGVGIPADRIDTIFEAYTISDGTKSKSHSRTAIGLAIAKGYADIISADIEVESVYGAGTTFTVSFNQSVKTVVSRNQAISKVENMVSKETAEKLWLPDVYGLLVDDDEVSREVSTKVLSSFEMKLDIASSGISAIDMVMNNDYDVVFIDLSMPIMNGIEVMSEIRDLADAKYAQLPIIAMDVDAIESNTAQLIGAGFTDSIVKPLDVRRVAAIFKDCLPSAKLKEKLSDIIQYIDNSRFGEGLKNLKPEIGVERAIEKIGGSIEVYNKLIAAYYKQNIMDTDSLIHMSEKDMRGFKQRIHSLRTFSVNIGAYKFAREAAQMEAAINKRNKDYIKHNTNRLVDNLNKLLLTIEEYIEYMEDYTGVTDEEHAKKNAKEYVSDSKEKQEVRIDSEKKDDIEASSQNDVSETKEETSNGKEIVESIDLDLLKRIRSLAKEANFEEITEVFNQINQYEYMGENKEFLNVLGEFIVAKEATSIEEIIGTYIDLGM